MLHMMTQPCCFGDHTELHITRSSSGVYSENIQSYKQQQQNKHTPTHTHTHYSCLFHSYIFSILSTFLIPCRKFRLPFLGTATATTTVDLPSSISVSGILGLNYCKITGNTHIKLYEKTTMLTTRI